MAFDPITAGIDLAREVGGKLIDHFFPDPEQAAKAKMELIQMENDGRLKEMVNDTERYKAEVADRQSARDHDSAIATSDAAPMLSKVVAPVLAFGVVGLTLLLFGIVLLDSSALDGSRKDLAVYILGALTTVVTQVISFYFGSSSGSVQKTDYMERLLRK